MLDQGGVEGDWFHSKPEIWIEATVSGLALYLFTVRYTATTDERSFLNRSLLIPPNEYPNFVRSFWHAADVQRQRGVAIMSGTLGAVADDAAEPGMNCYPALTTGLVTAPRGLGTMISMFLVGRLIGRVDNRLIILFPAFR